MDFIPDPWTKEWMPFPTPREFMEYLIDEIPVMGDVLNYNRHFAAQYTQCPFCSIKFDVLGSKETFRYKTGSPCLIITSGWFSFQR